MLKHLATSACAIALSFGAAAPAKAQANGDPGAAQRGTAEAQRRHAGERDRSTRGDPAGDKGGIRGAPADHR